jgi:hypothetical protein
MLRARQVLAVLFFALMACRGSNIVDNWPTFTVEGTVRSSSAAPVGGAQVEVLSYQGPCGQVNGFQRVTSFTNSVGHYTVGLDDPTGTFTGCVSVRATAGQPAVTVEADTVLSQMPIVEGQTRVTVNLQLP